MAGGRKVNFPLNENECTHLNNALGSLLLGEKNCTKMFSDPNISLIYIYLLDEVTPLRNGMQQINPITCKPCIVTVLANQVNMKENQAIPCPNKISKPASDLEAKTYSKVENVKLKPIKILTYCGIGGFRVTCYQPN